MLALLAGISMLQIHHPATTRTPLLAAYENLKYGMFIHFGMSTFTKIEIPREPGKLSDYNPTHLNVDQWIHTAKAAGMKYAVLTTKHVYGHCLWPSKATDFTVANSPVKTDVVRKFVDACHKYDVKPAFYYLLGWDVQHQPKMTPEQYEQFCRKQVTELLSDYGPILEVWFDIPWDMGPQTQTILDRMYDLVKTLQPNCLVMFSQSITVMNGGAADPFAEVGATYFYQPVDGRTRPWPCDITNGERTPPTGRHNPAMRVEGTTYHIPMEVFDTITPNWFWLPDDPVRPLRTLVRMVRGSVDAGANLLLDVPPDTTGRIPDAEVNRLLELRKAIDSGWNPVDYAHGAKAEASNVWRKDPTYSADKAIDGNPGTRWATEDSEKTATLDVDFGHERTISSVFLSEAYGRIRSFEIQAWTGHDWQKVFAGDKIGDGIEVHFPPTATSKVRLAILNSTGGPTIWSFEVGP